jgi:flagellar biosynthetic protein FliQ
VTASLTGLVREGLLLVLLCAAPFLVGALIAGIVSGLVGAVTQINDPSVSLVPRVAGVGVALVLFGPSIAHQIETFANRIWPLVATVGAANGS